MIVQNYYCIPNNSIESSFNSSLLHSGTSKKQKILLLRQKKQPVNSQTLLKEVDAGKISVKSSD
ncbi:MAG TPA: hypothetical protein VJ583_05720 [Nitrososphaeraceae archaeon]|nr:hypothetical protein [Nitrososphaeraceae archaeon]